MKFNQDKYEELHVVKVKQGKACTVNGRTNRDTEGCKYVFPLNKLFRKVKAAFGMFGCTSQGKSWDVTLQMYEMLVGQHQECCMQF